MKGTIVAIGGGSIGFKKKATTTPIDQAILALSPKKQPRILFIPTASKDSERYVEVFSRHYGTTLGMKHIDTLLLYSHPTSKEIREKIAAADIIYVGGGNTYRMMRFWKQLGVDKLLDKARKRGAVLCGLSAGAICWAAYGNSDSRRYSSGSESFIRVTGLGFVPLLICPHYNSEAGRPPSMPAMTKRTKEPAVTIDDNAAILIRDGVLTPLRAKKTARVQLAYWEDGQYVERKVKDGEHFVL